MLFTYGTVVGEGRARKEFLNPLTGPKSRSAVCGYCCPWPLTLLMYFICLMSFSFTIIFYDLIVNFLIPLYVNMYLVYSLSFINFGGLGSFLAYLLTCVAVVLVLEYRTAL